MSLRGRLLGGTAVLSAFAGAVAWFSTTKPSMDLVAQRNIPPRVADYAKLVRPNLDEVFIALEKEAIWGLQRDGRPLPPPKAIASEEEQRPLEWRVLANVVRGSERYLLIQKEQLLPETVKEGDKLPDGSLLIKITPHAYTRKTEEGNKEMVLGNL